MLATPKRSRTGISRLRAERPCAKGDDGERTCQQSFTGHASHGCRARKPTETKLA
jgi:hypothetical protein